MRNKVLVLLSLFLLTSMFASTLVAADCKLVMVFPTGVVQEGTDASVEIHVFDKDAPADPQVVTAKNEDGNYIPLTKKSKGVYSGTVGTSTDPSWTGHVDASATLGDTTDRSTIDVRTKKADTPKKNITLIAKDPAQLEPPITGRTIPFIIRTYLDGEPADDDTLETTFFQQTEQQKTNPSPTHISTGVYEMSVTIPDTDHSGRYLVNAWVTQANGNPKSANIELYVDFNQVWMHKVSITKTSATLEMYVADMKGKTVTSGTLDLYYRYWDTNDNLHSNVPMTSVHIDAKGKATITLVYTDPMDDVSFYGYVNVSGKTQEFESSFVVFPSAPVVNKIRPPSIPGLDIIYQNTEHLLVVKPSKTASLNFQAWRSDYPSYDFEKFANSSVYYYVYNYARVIAYGNVTTDSDGMFTLNFDVPAYSRYDANIIVDLRAESSPGLFLEVHEVFYISEFPLDPSSSGPYHEYDRDPRLYIGVDKLLKGGKTTVTTSPKIVTDSTLGFFAIAKGKVDMRDICNGYNETPEWTQTSIHGGNSDFMTRFGSSMVGQFYLPEFLPAGTYTIVVNVVEPAEWDYTYDRDWNYIYIDVGKGGSTGSEPGTTTTTTGALNDFILLIVIIIVVVVAIAGGLFVIRRSNAAKQHDVVTAKPQQVQPAKDPQQNIQVDPKYRQP